MKIQGKNIIVTGGAGFIGSHVVDLLVSKCNKVFVIDNLLTGKVENIKHHLNDGSIIFYNEDILNYDKIEQLFKNIDIVFHLAVANLRVSLDNPFMVHEINTSGTLNVCKASFESNINRFIYISSSESYGSCIYEPMNEEHPLNPTTIYGASKLAGELYSLAFWHSYKFPVIVVRPFNSYGPREHYEDKSAEVIPRFVFRVMSGMPPIIYGNGKQARDFTWVLDTAKGIVIAAECDDLIGSHINIARGEPITIEEISNLILSILGRKDLKPKCVLPKGRPGDVYRHYADVTKAKTLLKFKSDISIEEGLKRYISWIKKQDIDVEYWASKMDDKNW